MVDTGRGKSRRRILWSALWAAIGSTGVAILYPVVWFLRPRRATVSGALETVAPFRVAELAGGNPAPFEFAGKPCLVVLTEEGRERFRSGAALMSGDVRAFNAICTHVDCTVRHREAEGDIFCSCHDGVYDLNGHVVSGPPPRPLESYKVTLRGEAGQEEIVVSRES